MKLNPEKANILRNALNHLNGKVCSIDYRGIIVEYKMKYSLRKKTEFNCYIEFIGVGSIVNYGVFRAFQSTKRLRDSYLTDIAKIKFASDSRIIGLDSSIKLQNIFIKNSKMMKSVVV